MRHIVWDWNGTLFDDTHLVVEATNAAFAGLGVDRAIVIDDYRSLFIRPIPAFYERLLGRPLTDGEWERIDTAFHDEYAARLSEADLAGGVRELLSLWPDQRRSQSLLSMWRHVELVALVRSLGIDRDFVRIDGLRGQSDGGGKTRHLAAHLSALTVDPATVALIGDSVDDADAAAAVGARAVLYTGGLQSRSALAATGSPVVDSLEDAIDLVVSPASGC